MRGAIGAGLITALAMFCVSQAHARDVKISGTHSVSDIEIHCIDNGGTFFNAPHGGYGCAGSGGGTVTCTGKGKCTGTVSKVVGKGGKGNGITGVINALNTKSSSKGDIRPTRAATSMKTNTLSNNNNNMGQSGGMHHGRGR